MELLYDLLWNACSWILLSFLVSRFVALIVADDSASGSFSEAKTKRFGTLNHHKFVDDHDKVLGFDQKVMVDDEVVNDVIGDVFNQGIIKGFEMGELVEDKVVDLSKGEVKSKKIVGIEGKFGGNDEVVDHGNNVGVVLSSEKLVVEGESAVENSRITNEGEVSGRGFDEEGLSDEEDWEGVDRSELEKRFARAVNFVECKDDEGRLSKSGSDVIMQLYGLQKIAMEGTCHEAQPMALKLSARAKWNAWQKLGNMTREDAMEQYLELLSDNIPEWMEDHSSLDWKSSSSSTVVDSSTESY